MIKKEGSTANLVESYNFGYGFYKGFFQFGIRFW